MTTRPPIALLLLLTLGCVPDLDGDPGDGPADDDDASPLGVDCAETWGPDDCTDGDCGYTGLQAVMSEGFLQWQAAQTDPIASALVLRRISLEEMPGASYRVGFQWELQIDWLPLIGHEWKTVNDPDSVTVDDIATRLNGTHFLPSVDLDAELLDVEEAWDWVDSCEQQLGIEFEPTEFCFMGYSQSEDASTRSLWYDADGYTDTAEAGVGFDLTGDEEPYCGEWPFPG